MNDKLETDAEKAERWYAEYDAARIQLWEAQNQRDRLLEIVRAVRKEADKADRKNQDVSPAAIFWITRDVLL